MKTIETFKNMTDLSEKPQQADCYVYVYEDEMNRPIYIGKGRGKRYRDHLRIAKNRTKPHPFYNKLKKMIRLGFKPQFHKIKENLTPEEACALEIKIIRKIGRKDLGTGTLLNMSDGGEGLLNMSPVHKEIIRKRHTGKVNSPETIKKMSDSKKNIPKTLEHRKHLSDALMGKPLSQITREKLKNTRWVNNGKESIKIHKDELEKYLNDGWISGRHNYFTDESKKQMSKSALQKPAMSSDTRKKISQLFKNRCWVNNGIINKFIQDSELEQYLLNGWHKKRMKIKTNNRDQRRWINNGIANKAIHMSELDNYLLNGWKKGKYNKKSWITNGYENKLIDTSELNLFLANGWKNNKLQRSYA